MRGFVCFFTVACLGLTCSAAAQSNPASSQTPPADVNKILADARVALGGESRLTSVKTFTATGRTRQVRGDNLVPIEFEIFCELPDKYVRRDEIPAQESGPTSAGFNGEGLIQEPAQAMPGSTPGGTGRGGGMPAPAATPPTGAPAAAGGPPSRATPAPTPPAGGAPPPTPPAGAPSTANPPAGAPAAAGAGLPGVPGAPGAAPGRPGGPPMSPAAQMEMMRRTRVATVKQDFARLTLGMFAASFPSYPLTFSYGGQAEAPQGKADVIDVKGTGTFAVRLFIDQQTHLPIMTSWQVPTTNVVMSVPGLPPPGNVPPGALVVDAPPPPPATATQDERDTYTKQVAELRRKALAQAKPTEHRLYYADYRDVDGMQFPFRLRRAVAGQTIEETTFDRFRINAKIEARRFEVPK